MIQWLPSRDWMLRHPLLALVGALAMLYVTAYDQLVLPGMKSTVGADGTWVKETVPFYLYLGESGGQRLFAPLNALDRRVRPKLWDPKTSFEQGKKLMHRRSSSLFAW